VKEKLLEIISCPGCGARFTLVDEEKSGGEVETGKLLCSGCGKSYQISGFIPRILDSYKENIEEKTAGNFGDQWTLFTEMHSFYRELYLDWIYPLREEDIKGKMVLDAGCGMGRFLYYAAKFGAREAVGVDLSRSVDVAYQTVKDMPNAHVIQADLANLPFGPEFDLFYSIGVLHHTPDPESRFHSVCRALKPGGTAHAWVYGYENNEWIVKWVNPVREKFTSKLPAKALSAISFFITLFLQPVLKALYYPAGKRDIKPLKRLLPYFPYMNWLSRGSFSHTHVVIHDHLTAPVAFYIKKEDFQAWFERAGLEDAEFIHRNENSWTGVGRLKGGGAGK